MDIKRDIELLYEIGCFRFLDRTWKRFLNADFANNAEHTFRIIWIALMLAKHEGNDNHEKILKMALAHDLSESRTGDVDYLSRQYVNRYEEKAIEDIFKGTICDSEIVKIWKEYEKRESIEAKIVKDADNLDVELELKEQEERGHSVGSIWKENRRELIIPRLYTQSAKKFWDEIYNSNPHDWHLKGKNRFNSGDWKKQ